MNKDIVILAKSRKDNGYCVAGLDIYTGKWIRLVTDENGAPLLSIHTAYKNVAGFCEPLDVVRVEILKRVPHKNHTEDCLIRVMNMKKRGFTTMANLMRFHPPENYEYVFGNGLNSLSTQEMESNNFQYSLIFIRVKNMTVHYRGRSPRADFEYNGVIYKDFSITDPDYETSDGVSYNDGMRNTYLVVSMPDKPFFRDKRCYKFIAKIFPS